MKRLSTLTFLAVLVSLVTFHTDTLSAQGLLLEQHQHRRLPRPWPIRPNLPRPPEVLSYSIKSIDISGQLRDQVAEIQLSQTFVNTGSSQIEAQFVFPLPYDAAIDRVTLMVNGKELPGELLSRDAARRKYEEIVRSSKDPALLEWVGHGLFQTSVFPIPAGQQRTVTLHYTHLLRKNNGITDFLYPLATARYTAKPIESLSVALSINSTLPLKNVYSPTHKLDVKRDNEQRVRVSLELHDVVPTEDFRLVYDVNQQKVGASLLSYRPDGGDDGYFLLLASPQIKSAQEDLPKTVIFVVDQSGSMSGEKIVQAKKAADFVMQRLHEQDLFNIISYNASVTSFAPELQPANAEMRGRALGFIQDIRAGGSTNIHAALTTAMKQLTDNNRPTYVLFLTDGLPTAGEQNELKIAEAVRQSNQVQARLLNFGVGNDVNGRLLDRLARENHGGSEYVRPNENVEEYVSRIYSRITSPVMTNVELLVDADEHEISQGQPINRVYPGGKFDLFAGEQAVFVGRYSATGKATVTLKGNVGDERQSYSFAAELAAHSPDQSYAFIERLWATRRVGEIIDELDLKGKNQELIDELVQLSTKHGIMTPYTSFLADETARPTAITESESFMRNRRAADRDLDSLKIVSGSLGVGQRVTKQELKKAAQAAPASEMSAGEKADAYAVEYLDAKSGKVTSTENVRQIGNVTVYKRGVYLCTSATADLFSGDDKLELDLGALKDKVSVVERYTQDYFNLVAKNSAEENRVLATQGESEQLLVKLRGRVYLIK